MQKLNYAFLHEYDTTISDYIISLKMEYGAKLLSETLLASMKLHYSAVIITPLILYGCLKNIMG